jgi:hypothetical protein
VSHTPGPWFAEFDLDDEAHEITMGPDTEPECFESQRVLRYEHGLTPADGDQFEEADANADLIAAAPELINALLAIRACVRTTSQDDPSVYVVRIPRDVDVLIHRAILKARGES